MLLERQKFEFDDFLLDAKEKILLRGGKPLSITPKAFQLLLVLVENHGHLVEKDELMKLVWADSFVEEANLAFTIGLLRKALDDDAQKPRFIENVPKRGYRFIAEIKCVETKKEKDSKFNLIDNSAPSSDSEIFPPARIPRRINETGNQSSGSVIALADWRNEANANKSEEATTLLEFPPDISEKAVAEKTNVAALSGKNRTIAAVVLLLAGVFVLGYYFFSQKNAAVDDKKSIAVLPLKPINTANRDDIYEIGIADSLIHRLSSMKGFVIRPLNAIRKYADIEQDPIAAGREQKVDYILASNYQLANGKIRVTAQLFNVANGQIEDTYKIEKDAGDVFAMQDAIAGEIGNIFLARFATTESSPVAKRGTINEEAYRLYLQGMYLCDKRNLADARKAVEVLEQAVRLDPNYALAWAGKAYAHRVVGNHGRSINTHEEYQKSIAAINKALALDESLSEVHSALCDNKMYYEYDFNGAERECKRAIELDPDSSLAHQVFSRYLNSRGRFDEAIAEIKTAIDLEPTSFHNQRNLGVSLYFARRYEEAVAQYKRVIAMDKDFASTYMWLSFALEMQGNESENFEWFMKTPDMQNADEETVQAFQTAFQTSGWQGVLRERVKKFERSNEPYFQGAAYNAQIGNKDKAFEYLEKSYQRRELWMANLQVEPRLASLRNDQRFDELVRLVGSQP
jgi:DNA-binding winged helix-turn-helix (wHTH) protein/TolB-like protein/Tfp pilus assembly protein PilF